MKFDLHIHTSSSYDCLANIEDILIKAKQRGLDGIAITDHDQFHDYGINKLEDHYQIWIIPGIEKATEIGDIIGLYISNKVSVNNADEVIDEIHKQGGLAIFAHPFKRIKECPIDILKKFDAIELINSRWIDLQEYRGITKVDKILSLIQGRTAGSDAHFVFEIGNVYLETGLLNDKNALRSIICEGAGVPRCNRMTNWPDLMSQIVKFYKTPNYLQVMRLFYYFIRQVFQNKNRSRIS